MLYGRSWFKHSSTLSKPEQSAAVCTVAWQFKVSFLEARCSIAVAEKLQLLLTSDCLVRQLLPEGKLQWLCTAWNSSAIKGGAWAPFLPVSSDLTTHPLPLVCRGHQVGTEVLVDRRPQVSGEDLVPLMPRVDAVDSAEIAWYIW